MQELSILISQNDSRRGAAAGTGVIIDRDYCLE
jgi:hypothetical protein